MINSIDTLINSNIPQYAKDDCISRIKDWILSGGSYTDRYVANIYRYANLLERR